MSVRSGQSVTVEFTTRVWSTGVGTNADSLPTGTLVVNGTDNAATVTVTNVDTGRYKAAVTLPTLAVGDVVELMIAATVSSIADKAIVWRDTKDILLDSSGDVTFNNITLATVTTVTNQLTAAAIATGVWQDTTAGDFTVASSIGKSLYTSGAAPGAASGLLIAGSNAATTFATLTSTGAFSINGTSDVAQTGDSFARLGAPAGASVSADIAEIEGETDTLLTNVAAIPTNPYTGTPPTVAQIATAVWQDTTASDFTTASSIGKSLGGAFTALGNSVFTVAALANAPSGGGGGGNVTVAGYASGQDPATLVLDVLASGHNLASSIGADINAIPGLASQLTAIQAKLGAASVTVSSPVARSGAVSLIRGDSYYQADGRGLAFADSGGTWPNLTGASVTLSFVASGSVLLAAPAVVDVAGGSSQAVHVDLSAAQTSALPNACGCQLTAVLSSGHTATLSRGSVTVSGPG